MTRNVKFASALALWVGLVATSATATAGDRTSIVVRVDDGHLGLGLSYSNGGWWGPSYGWQRGDRDRGHHPHRRYDERYRYYGYQAPPPYRPPPARGGYLRGYREGYRDGTRESQRASEYYDRRYEERGRW